ncbi:hypothetical protein KI387_017385, partial [Taxus chinensis]
RRIASESPSEDTPNKRELNSGSNNEGCGGNPDVSPAKRKNMFRNSEEKPLPTSSNLENCSREIQSSTASPYTEFSLGTPIMGFRAQAFMDATPSSGESEVAAEFLSHPPYQMWMNSYGEPKAETCEDCTHAGDNKDYPEMESG